MASPHGNHGALDNIQWHKYDPCLCTLREKIGKGPHTIQDSASFGQHLIITIWTGIPSPFVRQTYMLCIKAGDFSVSEKKKKTSGPCLTFFLKIFSKGLLCSWSISVATIQTAFTWRAKVPRPRVQGRRAEGLVTFLVLVKQPSLQEKSTISLRKTGTCRANKCYWMAMCWQLTPMETSQSWSQCRWREQSP